LAELFGNETSQADAELETAAKARRAEGRQRGGKEAGRGRPKQLLCKATRKLFRQRARDDLGRLAGISGRLIGDGQLACWPSSCSLPSGRYDGTRTPRLGRERGVGWRTVREVGVVVGGVVLLGLLVGISSTGGP